MTTISGKGLPGFRGIIAHWTAGGPKASPLDAMHYHYMVQFDGSVVPGVHEPADNLDVNDGDYAAHALGANTGRLGVAVCGMRGAVERPFDPGPSPINWGQVNALCGLLASLCVRYSVPVTRRTVLTHAEVQPTLGIRQKGKWDITWLPGMVRPGDPIEVGDRIRAEVLKHMKGGV